MHNSFSGLVKALKSGNKIHCFLSGGGLRVVRIEKVGGGALKGYGEHPHFMEAIRHADEDFLAGGRPYNKVYGENGLYDCYLTGASTPEKGIDQWVRSGNAVDFFYHGGKFILETEQFRHCGPPKELTDRVATTGKAERWVCPETAYVYLAEPMRFPNGLPGTSIKCMNEKANGKDPWYRNYPIVIKANTFEELISKADKELPTYFQS
jgi:hypothetical protein